MAASCVRQHWVWRQSGPGTQTVKSATMRSEHRQDLKTLACMDLPCGPCTAPAAMPAASRLLARQPTILHDPSRPPGRRVVFKRGAQARSLYGAPQDATRGGAGRGWRLAAGRAPLRR